MRNTYLIFYEIRDDKALSHHRGFENPLSAASGDVTTKIRHPLESRRGCKCWIFSTS
jgi:hypothetical protein